ncbi:rhomboid family intramembrane serine protease [Apibacter raozihei]|uniref:rhomboid family intramembrane serine protease n=1 Tax=Apibacter TaxID=1778601 RepID=UPI000FE3C581|nr:MULTISPECIES: rhomboid family intramembrane serine protease [Apibacter]
MKKISIKKEAIIIPLLLILVIWAVFFIQSFIGLRECYGIIPLSFKGLRGVLLAPLFHGSFQHIFNNSIPLLVLTFLIFQFYDKLAYFVLVNGWIFSGLVVWMLPDFAFANSSILSCHIGASGVIYVLAFFLFFSGVFRKERALRAVSLVVVFLYGGIVWGVLPQEFFGIQTENKISWESHLSGALIGFILAFLLRKTGRLKHKSSWERKEYDSLADDELWERYKEEYPEEFDNNYLNNSMNKDLKDSNNINICDCKSKDQGNDLKSTDSK